MNSVQPPFINSLLTAWNSHDVEAIVAHYAVDYHGADVSEAHAQQGQNGIRRSITRYLTAFGDLQLSLDSYLAQGDQIALFWTAKGTHNGRFMNIPATRQPVCWQGATLLTLVDGQIYHSFHLWDVAGFLRMIRLLPRLRA